MTSSFAKAMITSPVFRGLRPFSKKKTQAVYDLNKSAATLAHGKKEDSNVNSAKKYSACGIFAKNAFCDYLDLSLKQKPFLSSTSAAIGILSPNKTNKHQVDATQH